MYTYFGVTIKKISRIVFIIQFFENNVARQSQCGSIIEWFLLENIKSYVKKHLDYSQPF